MTEPAPHLATQNAELTQELRRLVQRLDACPAARNRAPQSIADDPVAFLESAEKQPPSIVVNRVLQRATQTLRDALHGCESPR